MKRLMCLVVVMVGMFAGVARADIPGTERDVLVASNPTQLKARC